MIYTTYAVIYHFPLFLEGAHLGSYVHFALVCLSQVYAYFPTHFPFQTCYCYHFSQSRCCFILRGLNKAFVIDVFMLMNLFSQDSKKYYPSPIPILYFCNYSFSGDKKRRLTCLRHLLSGGGEWGGSTAPPHPQKFENESVGPKIYIV